jgi:hypothetical protein
MDIKTWKLLGRNSLFQKSQKDLREHPSLRDFLVGDERWGHPTERGYVNGNHNKDNQGLSRTFVGMCSWRNEEAWKKDELEQ